MFINETEHIIVLSKGPADYKIDLVAVGGFIMHFHTENGGKIKMAHDTENVYILVVNPTPEAWKQIMDEIKAWSTLRKRVIMYERDKKMEEKAKDREGFFKKFFGKG